MEFEDTSDHEIFALMLFPTPHQRCWHDGVEAYCRGTIWQSSVQLELQCAFFRVYYSFCTFFLNHTEIYTFLFNFFYILSQHQVCGLDSQDGDCYNFPFIAVIIPPFPHTDDFTINFIPFLLFSQFSQHTAIFFRFSLYNYFFHLSL